MAVNARDLEAPVNDHQPSQPKFLVHSWDRLNRSGIMLALPALLCVVFIFLIPLGRIIWQSLTEHATSSGGSEQYFGLGNYLTLFTDGFTISILKRTLTVAGMIALITGLFGYPLAYMMTIVPPRTRAVLITLVLVPFWTSALARSFAWVILLDEGGPVDDIFHVVVRGTPFGVALGMGQVLLPFAILPMYSVMSGIDRNLIAAAESLGANRFVAFWRIYFPLSLPGVTTGVTLVFILSLGFYITPALLGSSQEAMIAQLIIVRTELLDFGGAGALGIFVLIVTLILLGFGAWLTKIFGSRVTTGSVVGAGPVVEKIDAEDS